MGQLRPAVDGDLAVLGIQPDDDVIGKLRRDLAHEMRRADRLGTDDDVVDAGIEVFLNGVLVADTAAHLDFNLGIGLADGVYDPAVPRLAGEGAVKVDQMQTCRAILDPATGDGHGIIGKNRIVFHAALPQSDTLAIFEVDSRYQKHGNILGV